MAHRVKTLLISAAARALGWLSASEGGFRKFAVLAAKPVFALGRLGFRFVFVPLYAVGYAVKRTLRRVANPAKNRVMFVMANRYVVHALVIVIAAATSAVSLYAREVRAENLGEQSILYKLVRGADEELTEETSDAPMQVVSYFDPPAVEAQLDVDDISPEDAADFATIGDAALVQPSLSDTDVTPSGTRAKPETYMVMEGDTLSGIAKKFGISINTILWENKLTPRDFLKPGQSLVILQASGLTHTVAKGDTLGRIAGRYGVTADEIMTANKLASADDLRVGEKLLVPGGEPPTPVAPARPRPTLATVRQILTADRGGTPPPGAAPTSGGRMVWPTSWRVITQYYGWRHTGIDIDGDYNSPIYASEAGVVTHAGWGRTKGGYGYYVDMDHGGGIKTRYGHASKIFVNVGDQVAKGQTIAMVGTTGRSTGTHLHFEVIVNGKFTNPLQWTR